MHIFETFNSFSFVLKANNYFSSRRKLDVVGAQNLFTLLTDRLLLHASYLSLATYNVLFELLTEQMTPNISYTKHADPNNDIRFENSGHFQSTGQHSFRYYLFQQFLK